jgi:hypothetical protein
VKSYRGQVMRKMAVKSLADLVRLAEELGLDGKRVNVEGRSDSLPS